MTGALQVGNERRRSLLDLVYPHNTQLRSLLAIFQAVSDDESSEALGASSSATGCRPTVQDRSGDRQ